MRHRRLVGALWLLSAVLLVPLASRVGSELEVTAQLPESEALAVERALATRFGSPFAHTVVLVVTGIPSPDTPVGRALLSGVVDSVRAVRGVSAITSYLDVADTLFLGRESNGTFVIVGLDPHGARLDALIPPLRDLTHRLEAGLRRTHPGAALRVTGEVAINFDLRETSALEARRAEMRMLPVTAVLLLLAFGAAVAALLPLIGGGLAIALTLGAAALINAVWPLSILLENVVSMVGFGVGIDYAMLTVSRFREALAEGRGVEDAAVDAAQHAGGTIALSGAAVVIGFAALAFVPVNELQSIGIGGVIVVAVSVLLAATLLPGVLAALGRRVDAGRWRRGAPGAPMERRWRQWGAVVTAHPGLVLLASSPLLLLVWQAPRLRPELPRGDWLPASMESARGLAELEAMGRGGIVHTMRVLLELPPGASVFAAAGWAATGRLGAALADDPRVARVRSLPILISPALPDPTTLGTLPSTVRATMASPDGRATMIELLPHDAVNFNELSDFSRELRQLDAERLSGMPGVRIAVGGMPAFNADYIDAISTRFRAIITAVIVGTLLALMLGFRSVLVPLKAVALNLVSVGAALGAVVLVFQDGHGASLLGVAAPMHGVFPAVPILVFCIVFGLSMDYEVFLVARVAEARRAGLDESAAIAEGLARTGGVITSAAMIMVAVFAAFMLGSFLLIKVLGFALAVAVALDATIVRVAIGPALLSLAGRWNWWPGHAARGVTPASSATGAQGLDR